MTSRMIQITQTHDANFEYLCPVAMEWNSIIYLVEDLPGNLKLFSSVFLATDCKFLNFFLIYASLTCLQWLTISAQPETDRIS